MPYKCYQVKVESRFWKMLVVEKINISKVILQTYFSWTNISHSCRYLKIQGPFNYVYIVSLKLPFVHEFVKLNRWKRRRVICWWQFEELHRGKLIAHLFNNGLMFTFNPHKTQKSFQSMIRCAIWVFVTFLYLRFFIV